MELKSQLHLQIDDIQRKLRECNFDCNRLKELIDKSLLAPANINPTPAIEPALPKVVAPAPAVEPAKVPEPQVVAAINTPIARQVAVNQPAQSRPEPKPKAPRDNAKLEEFIGGNLLNKIGIGILIIGIGIFVKYAIDKDWIGPIGRVMIGVLSGGILLGLAHYLRQSYKAFSSVLLGGGLAVFYFSIAIAFHEYQLFGQTTAFALMCGVTGIGVFFSLAYDRQEIAFIGALGGFLTPFLLVNGEGNYIALFTYLVILNIGMLSLSALRNWQAVRVMSFAATVLIYLGWLLRNIISSNDPVLGGTLAFGIAFFTVFFAMNLVFYARAKKPLGALEYVLLLFNSAFFYGSGLAILSQTAGGIYMGLYTALLGAFHFAFIFPVRRLIQVDNKVQVMLIGLVLTFLTLALPIQLEGRYLTMFWSLEAALVLYLGQRFAIPILRRSSQIISGLALIAILVDWSQFYVLDALPENRVLFLNGAFVTGLVASLGLVLQYLFYQRESASNAISGFASGIIRIAMVPLLYLVFALELGVHFGQTGAGPAWIAVLAFSFLYFAALHVWARTGGHQLLAMISVALTAIGLLGYMVFHFGVLHPLDSFNRLDLQAQFLILPGLAAAFVLSAMALHKQFGWGGITGNIWVWTSAAAGILVLSLTLDNILGLSFSDLAQVHRTGYPILWGLVGAGMIVAGLRAKVLALRSGGLLLFLLILVKLFAFDIQEASTGGKIAAFICLGILLLLISFLYQKLKLLLIDEKAEPNEKSDKI